VISRIHQKLGTAGFIISIVALVAALGGGAYGASGALTGKQKKEVEKIAKKYAGKPGAPGGTGATGPAGPNGSNGGNGSKGDTGPEGKQGPEGKRGQEGSPWTDGGTLPTGSEETGVWSYFQPATEEAQELSVPISFTIPLASSINNAFFFTKEQVENEEFQGGCHWVTELFEDPNAQPESTTAGTLCVFTGGEEELIGNLQRPTEIVNPSHRFSTKAGPSGAYLSFFKKETAGHAERLRAEGTWAVSAP